MASAADGNATVEAQLAEGQNLTGLVIRLAGRARLTGRLVAFDGSEALSGYSVMVAPLEPDGSSSFRNGETGESPRSGADGRFVVEGGNDLRGDPTSYYGLATVPPGTAVTLGLARGASVRIIAAEPR